MVQLPGLLEEYVTSYVFEGVTPALVRKAMKEGFINMLTSNIPCLGTSG